MQPILEAKRVTAKSISEVLNQSGIPHLQGQQGPLMIFDEHGHMVLVHVFEERGFILLTFRFELNEDTSMDEKLVFANKLNDELIMVRFCVTSETAMLCDTTLLFNSGLLTTALQEYISRFFSVIHDALALDEDNIIVKQNNQD